MKGFTEALITDFAVNAPHLRASVVMPGWVGTSIVLNSERFHGGEVGTMTGFGEMFRDRAPVTAAQASTIILDAVQADEWRILIGDDASALDEAVRADPANTFLFALPSA